MWSSCTVATVWQAILCALLSHVPAFSTLGTTSEAWFWIFPSAGGEVAVMDGDVKMPDSLAVKPLCTFRIMFYNQLIYVGFPGLKIRECKYQVFMLGLQVLR